MQHRAPALAGLNLPAEFVLPHFGLSIANLPGTLAALLGGRLAGAAPPLPPTWWADLAPGLRRVVWIILDAVGWQHLCRMLESEPDLALTRLAEAGRLLPLTSIFPSTTTSALTTLWSGYFPAQHGLVGHEMYLRELGLVVDTLGFSPVGEPRRNQLLKRGLDPEKFLPVPGLAQILAEQGITTRVLVHTSLADSGLSQLCFRGVREVAGYITSADMWVCLRQMLAAHLDECLLLAAYWGEVDAISHTRGPDSESWQAELRNLSFSLEREFLRGLSPQERDGTLLVITSDHGQIAGRFDSSVQLADHPVLRDCLLLPPTGGPRSAYLFTRQGQVEVAQRYLQEALCHQFAVITPVAALEAGLLGPGCPADQSLYRLGDLIVLARGAYMLDYRKRDHPLLGLHGGLSPWEMVVPLLMMRLDGNMLLRP